MNKGLRWKETIAGVEAPNLMVVETQLPAGRNQTFATPADIVACLKANPEAAGQVCGALQRQFAPEREAIALARAEQAERSLTTVTAERDEARYWLAAHKAAAESLVDPVTGQGFFMLIGKGDDGVDGWFYTFGGPFDSYTLCERSDDEDPHFVYFQRERYDHDQGCWIDGCEVVEPVLAPDECSVAPYCLEDVTEERDALKRERDEARAERDAAVDRLVGARVARESAIEDAEALRAQLAKTARERDDAMTLAEERRDYARAQNAKLSVECDDLRAQLTAVERERDEAHAALRDCATRLENGSAVSPKASHAFHCAVATEVGIVVPALRAKLAKTERVVEAASDMLTGNCACDKYGVADTCSCAYEREERLRVALRALDSPVGVAATACDHKRQRCENDHAVCRDCGAVNRAVTGVADWGPPETDRQDGSTGAVACKSCERYPGPGNAKACADMKGFPFAPGEDCACRCHDERDPQAPATRAEVEALRRRVERLENLTGSGSGSGSG